MNEVDYRSDMLYHIALSAAKGLLEKGVITEEEYRRIDTMLLKKYHPYLGTLLSENDLI